MTLARNGPCVLCEMVAGREEASPAYEDEHVIAVMDLSPVTQGHLFVFPRTHVESLEALDAGLGAAFQEVFHVHLHVFPRTRGDGFRIEADWRQRDRAELDAAAEQIRRGLRAVKSPENPP